MLIKWSVILLINGSSLWRGYIMRSFVILLGQKWSSVAIEYTLNSMLSFHRSNRRYQFLVHHIVREWSANGACETLRKHRNPLLDVLLAKGAANSWSNWDISQSDVYYRKTKASCASVRRPWRSGVPSCSGHSQRLTQCTQHSTWGFLVLHINTKLEGLPLGCWDSNFLAGVQFLAGTYFFIFTKNYLHRIDVAKCF